ncbi:MAG: hypothetical protein ABII82_01945 [Verrucomicrobiota bacterium]
MNAATQHVQQPDVLEELTAPHQTAHGIPLIERLLALPHSTDFGKVVRKALGPRNYAHACGHYGATAGGGKCSLCGSADPKRIVGPGTGGDWCITDILRLPFKGSGRNGLRLLDPIGGIKGKASTFEPRLQMKLPVALEIVHREPDGRPTPWTLNVQVPNPEDEANSADSDGVEHHTGNQWRERAERTYGLDGAEFILPLYDPIPQASALFLLRAAGWYARKGGETTKRYMPVDQRQARAFEADLVVRDEWRIVEKAALIMHPDWAPNAAERRSRIRALPKTGQSAAPAPTNGQELEALRQQNEQLGMRLAELEKAATSGKARGNHHKEAAD